MKILVDWRAAILAGLAAGTLFLILNLLLIPEIIGGTTEMVIRYLASIPLGQQVVNPGYDYGSITVVVAVLLHYLLSVLFAMVVAFVVHRSGVVGGTIGGLILGLAFYLINMYAATEVFYWFFALESTIFLIAHLFFGAAVGALYEVMERREYEIAQGEITE